MRQTWFEFNSLPLAPRSSWTFGWDDKLQSPCYPHQSSLLWTQQKSPWQDHKGTSTLLLKTQKVMRHECLRLRGGVRIFGVGLSTLQKTTPHVSLLLIIELSKNWSKSTKVRFLLWHTSRFIQSNLKISDLYIDLMEANPHSTIFLFVNSSSGGGMGAKLLSQEVSPPKK